MLKLLSGVLLWAAGQAGLLAHLPHVAQLAVQGVAALLGALGVRGAAATAPSDALTALLDKVGGGWKTVAGVIATVMGVVLAPDVLAVLPAGLAHFLQAAGPVLAALGLYHANAKAGSGVGGR